MFSYVSIGTPQTQPPSATRLRLARKPPNEPCPVSKKQTLILGLTGHKPKVGYKPIGCATILRSIPACLPSVHEVFFNGDLRQVPRPGDRLARKPPNEPCPVSKKQTLILRLTSGIPDTNLTSGINPLVVRSFSDPSQCLYQSSMRCSSMAIFLSFHVMLRDVLFSIRGDSWRTTSRLSVWSVFAVQNCLWE